MSDAKEEIEGILERRPPDHETLWPLGMDGCYGNPLDICETCSHQRQVHGHPDCDDLGSGECNAMVGGTDLLNPTGGEGEMGKTLQSLLPASLHDSFMIKVGAKMCDCKEFKGAKPKSRLDEMMIRINNSVD